MNLYEKALTFAIIKHGDQKRKYTGVPYIVHPIAVASLVGQAADESGITNASPDWKYWQAAYAAALNHDVLEDTDCTKQEMLDALGNLVTEFVYEVTDVSKPEDGNRATRKALDREHLSRASFWGKTIKLADFIDNTKDIVDNDKNFAVQYLREKELALPHLHGGCLYLFNMAHHQLAVGKKLLGL